STRKRRTSSWTSDAARVCSTRRCARSGSASTARSPSCGKRPVRWRSATRSVSPFADGSVGAAASLYTLYFFEDPGLVAAEAWRVLKPGGLFAVCAPSRYDAPEIAHLARRLDTEAFASEDIDELLAERFVDVEVHEWNFP